MRLPTSLICLVVLSYSYASPLGSASCAAATGTASACHSGSWDFVANHLMPAMDNKASWSFAAYCCLVYTVNPLNNDCPVFVTPPASSSSDICASLDDVGAELLSKDVFAAINLTTVANKMQQCMGTNKFNLLLLITENKDQTGIQAALSIFKSQGVDVVVVNLGSGDFSPAQSLCPKQPLGQQPQKDIIDGLLNAFCGKPAKDFMASILTPISIGQGPEQTRVGTIVYADGAQLVSRLSSFKKTQDMQMAFFGLKFPNQENTNIDSATDMARDAFEDPNEHRPNARKVIVIHASTFRINSNYSETEHFAHTFKENNGIIIVILHGDDHGHTVPVLKKIASNGYFFDLDSNSDPSAVVQFFKQSVCNANCFCNAEYKNIDNDAGNQLAPTDGCFWSATENSMGSFLNEVCEQHNGTAAVTKTAKQRIAVARGKPNAEFFVGLTYNSASEQWLWADKTVFEPLKYDPVLDHTNGNCAVVQSSAFNMPIHAVDCAALKLYGCQATPCSTANFCSDP